MPRRNLSLWLPVTLLILGLGLAWVMLGRERGAERPGAPPFEPARYNVVLISIDTLRADRLGTYGYGRWTSPVLDRLARESVVFSDVLAQSPTTAPSHRSIFTGRYVYEHRNGAAGLPPMPRIFRDAGYETAAFVDGGQLSREFRLDVGFDLYHQSEPVDERSQLGGGLAVIAPEVVAWLRRDRERPFFLFVHTYDVHCPYTPPFPYRDLFTRELAYTPDFEVEGRCGRNGFNQLNLDRDGFRYISALYDGGVRYADARLAAILDECRSDDTIVVVTSDHGESLGERERVGHNQVFDVQLRVPLLMRIPRVEPRVVGFPAQGIDLLPTLASLVGLTVEEEISGEDLAPSFLADRTEDRRVRLAESQNTVHRTLRTGPRWSLRTKRGETVALYDLFTDPAETRNVVDLHERIVWELEDAYDARQLPAETLTGVPGDLADRTRRQLEALGYVGD